MIRDHERYLTDRIDRRLAGCWPWLGTIGPRGYGVAHMGAGRRKTAHRAVYELLVGPIPADLRLDHRCHNEDESCPGGSGCRHRRCVNPGHLDIVTPGENARRGKGPGALNLQKTHCPRGHAYDHVDRRGWRKCSACMKETRTTRLRAAGVKPTRAGATHCQRGHEYTAENTYWLSQAIPPAYTQFIGEFLIEQLAAVA